MLRVEGGKERKPHWLGMEEEVFLGSQSVVEADIQHQKELNNRQQGREESVVMCLDTFDCL